MQFQTPEDLRKLSELLGESDFDRADCSWGGVFVLQTSRPAEGASQPAGLLRKARAEWIPCRLTFRNVREVSIWEEYDSKPAEGRFLQVTEASAGAEVLLSSTHGLRVRLVLSRLEGTLEDAAA